MVRFSQDVDLLKWEPVMFSELALASQTLCQGTDGAISGTTFTSAGADFSASAVGTGHVVYLRSADLTIDGCYEVVSIDSATQLTVSIVRQAIDDSAVAPPAGSGLTWRISTFDPQAEEAGYSLLEYFGINAESGGVGINVDDILDNRALRQASVFAVLAAVFAGTAAGEDDSRGLWEKSQRYQKLFGGARDKARVGIDTNSDNIAEQYLSGGVVRLRRM